MRKMSIDAILFLILLAAAASAIGAVETTVLDSNSLWRCFAVRGSELCRTGSGELKHVNEFTPVNRRKVRNKETRKTRRVYEPNLVEKPWYTVFPPEDWRTPDFDAYTWARVQLPVYAKNRFIPTVLVCLRGNFRVEDPKKAADLSLSMSFQGGAAVYVNGKEISRSYLPKGELKPDTPAEDYAKEAFFASDGNVLFRRYAGQFKKPDLKKHPESLAMRTRKISSLKIPVSALRKGVNVLVIELHRSPVPEGVLKTGKTIHYAFWQRVGVTDLKLTAAAGNAVPISASGKGVRAFNVPVDERITPKITVDPGAELRPVRIVGVRNGAFSGKVLVASSGGLSGLKADASDLKGPGVIPAKSVLVRYGLADGRSRRRVWFDGLAETAPGQTAKSKAGTSILPVWVTVNVSRDAKPGEYEGKLTVRPQEADPIEVPVTMEVIDWVLPDSKDFIAHVGLVQSPESLAMQYNVPLWSEEHWKLLDRTFKTLAQVGAKEIFITAIRHTHFGNEHSMIRYIKENGSFKPDFSIAKRYLDTAVKHLGKVPAVGLYCWEMNAPNAANFPHLTPEQMLKSERQVLISVKDPKTGELSEGPPLKWGTPECQKLWDDVFRGMKAILKKRGMEKSLLFAMAGDYVPSTVSTGQLHKAAPDVKWMVHSHTHRSKIHNVPTGLLACVWGVFGASDPVSTGKRYYGWQNPYCVAFSRVGCPVYEISGFNPPGHYRYMGEGAFVSSGRGAGVRGFARMAADFWGVMKDKRGRKASIAGRYPEVRWGQLRMGLHSNLLSPGKAGAIATARFEMLREGLQETEARVFIEKALLDPEKKAKLGNDAARLQALLDERVRNFMRALGVRNSVTPDWTWYRGWNWQRASRQLFVEAAGVAGKLGDT